MIVYGWNSYALKKFTPEELGAAYDPSNRLMFEHRQKYAHIFFIPIFPIGKFWAIRKEGKLYEPTEEIKDLLRTIRYSTKQWIWAWSGPMAALLIFILVSISQSVKEREYNNRLASETSVLSTYFTDKSKTTPLADKMESMYTIMDSVMQHDDFKATRIDTSSDNLLKLYMNAQLTQLDSLTGYTPANTYILKWVHNKQREYHLADEATEASLKKHNWTGGSKDTSSVFRQLRELEAYRYILTLKEYNRLEPEVNEEGYNSGYTFVNAAIIDIATHRVLKQFKIMAGNSDKVSTYSMGKQQTSSYEWKNILANDLDNNINEAAAYYVFGKKKKRTLVD